MQHVFYNSHCALVAARLKQRHPRSGWSGPDRIAATVEASGAFRSNDPSKLDGCSAETASPLAAHTSRLLRRGTKANRRWDSKRPPHRGNTRLPKWSTCVTARVWGEEPALPGRSSWHNQRASTSKMKDDRPITPGYPIIAGAEHCVPPWSLGRGRRLGH
ncbi:hypothetical protein CI102_10148 [Trichoderma harzianum]|nr:hypothetical protein CI102_10148 [Trichoderma harzianum]